MFTFATLCAVIGIVLGLRFRIMVLVPMTAIVVAMVVALNISHGKALSAATVEAVIAIIASGLGYVCGATARLLVLSRRASAGRRSATGNDGGDEVNRD
jgi:hypothetical protein